LTPDVRTVTPAAVPAAAERPEGARSVGSGAEPRPSNE
jgi:hypothetical protein